MNPRLWLALGAVTVAVGLFFVFKPDDGDDVAATGRESSSTTTTSTPTVETGTTDEVETTAETAPEPPPAQRIVVRVTGGQPQSGIKRVEIERGRQVVLVVRSDAADRVHVHGYELMQDVAPGRPARIRFRARLVGRFDVELEDRHVPLAELRVTP